jgi:hypothetical protein
MPSKQVIETIQIVLHSYALAASGLRTPPNPHPTLTLISLSAGFALIALASVSIPPKQEARSHADWS